MESGSICGYKNRKSRSQLTLNAKLNYPPNDEESSKILEQENDVLEAVFLADESGAHTCFEVGGGCRGDPINRPDVRRRAWTGEDGSEEIKEQIQETFFFLSPGLEFEFGSSGGAVRHLGAAGTEMRQSPGGAHGSGGDDECVGVLRSLYPLHPPQWLPLQWDWRGGQGGFRIL